MAILVIDVAGTKLNVCSSFFSDQANPFLCRERPKI